MPVREWQASFSKVHVRDLTAADTPLPQWEPVCGQLQAGELFREGSSELFDEWTLREFKHFETLSPDQDFFAETLNDQFLAQLNASSVHGSPGHIYFGIPDEHSRVVGFYMTDSSLKDKIARDLQRFLKEEVVLGQFACATFTDCQVLVDLGADEALETVTVSSHLEVHLRALPMSPHIHRSLLQLCEDDVRYVGDEIERHAHPSVRKVGSRGWVLLQFATVLVVSLHRSTVYSLNPSPNPSSLPATHHSRRLGKL